jgi:hypothetical protein
MPNIPVGMLAKGLVEVNIGVKTRVDIILEGAKAQCAPNTMETLVNATGPL